MVSSILHSTAQSSVIGVVVTPTVIVIVVVVVVVGAGLAWLFRGASGSQPIAELRNAFQEFEAAQRRDDTAAMARHAAEVRRLAGDLGPTNAEANGYVSTVAAAGY